LIKYKKEKFSSLTSQQIRNIPSTQQQQQRINLRQIVQGHVTSKEIMLGENARSIFSFFPSLIPQPTQGSNYSNCTFRASLAFAANAILHIPCHNIPPPPPRHHHATFYRFSIIQIHQRAAPERLKKRIVKHTKSSVINLIRVLLLFKDI